MAQDTAHTTQYTKRHIGEGEPSGLGHRTSKAKDGARTPVNRSQVAQDTAHATQHTEQAQRRTGAK